MSKGNFEFNSKIIAATCLAAFSFQQASLAADVAPAVSADAAAAPKPVATKLAAPKAASKSDTAAPPFPVAGKVSRTLQTVTGLNFLGSLIAGQAAGSVLKKKMGGNVKVKVKLYSFTDLLSGKVKAVDCSMADSKIKGVSLGHINATTNQPIWLDLHDKRHIQLKAPILVSVKTALTPDEIAAALKSDKVSKSLRGLNLDLPGLGDSQLQVVNPKVAITDENVCIEALLKAEGADDSKGLPIKITGKLRLKGDSRIEIADMKVDSSEIIEPEKFAVFAEELLNPLIDLRKLDRRDHAFRLTSLDVDHNGLVSEGRLLIVPKTPQTVAQTPTGIAGTAQKTK